MMKAYTNFTFVVCSLASLVFNTSSAINFTARSIANFDLNSFEDELRLGLSQNKSLVNITTADGCTPLIEAAKLGHHQHVRLLVQELQSGFPNMTEARCIGGKTALHFAAICTNQHESQVKHSICPDHLSKHSHDEDDSHERVVMELIDAGANVNALDDEQRTPAHYAALNGHVDVLLRLLSSGSNASATDRSQWTPLYYASQRGDVEATTILLQYTKNVNHIDWAGATPLIHACQIGHESVAKLLLDAGMDPWIQDHHMKRAIDYALDRGSSSAHLVHLLQANMNPDYHEL